MLQLALYRSIGCPLLPSLCQSLIFLVLYLHIVCKIVYLGEHFYEIVWYISLWEMNTTETQILFLMYMYMYKLFQNTHSFCVALFFIKWVGYSLIYKWFSKKFWDKFCIPTKEFLKNNHSFITWIANKGWEHEMTDQNLQCLHEASMDNAFIPGKLILLIMN